MDLTTESMTAKLIAVQEPMAECGFNRQVTRLCVVSKEIAGEVRVGTGKQICEAAGDGNTEVLSVYLKYWQDDSEASHVLNWCGGDGMTPLHSAVEGGHIEVARLLVVAKGIDLYAYVEEDDIEEGDDRVTALSMAELLKNDEMVAIIRAEMKEYAREALREAAGEGKMDKLRPLLQKWSGNEEILNWTVDEDGCEDEYYESKWDGTPLVLASGRGDAEMVTLLVSTPGVDVNVAVCVGQARNTPLLTAAKNNHANVVRILLKQPEIDISVDDGDMPGQSAIMAAAGGGYTETLSALLECATIEQINQKSEYRGITALMYAAGGGSVACVRLLLAVDGISLNECGDRKEHKFLTALHVARDWGHNEIVELLEERGAVEYRAEHDAW